MKTNDIDSLNHTSWNCKYHIVFAPKYRRKVAYENMRAEIGKILRELCTWKRVEIIEAEVCSDHIHMLVKIPPKMSVSGFVGFLKGKSTLLIFERHANLKYKYGNRTFWCRGYFVDTAGKNDKAIAEYIKNQLVEDQIEDQMTLKEYTCQRRKGNDGNADENIAGNTFFGFLHTGCSAAGISVGGTVWMPVLSLPFKR